MKIYIFIFLLLTPLAPILAQSTDLIAIDDPLFDSQFAKRTPPKVTGQLINISPEERQKITIQCIIQTLKEQKTKTIRVNPDGSFRLELDYPLPYQEIMIEASDLFNIGIYAHQDIHLEFDIKKIKESRSQGDDTGIGISYLGSDGPLNRYIADYMRYKSNQRMDLESRLRLATGDKPSAQVPKITELMAAYGPILNSLKTLQQEYIAAHPSPYAWIIENELTSNVYSQFCVYYWDHVMEDSLFNKIKEHKTYLNQSTVRTSTSVYPRILASSFRIVGVSIIRRLPASPTSIRWNRAPLIL